MKSLEFRRHSLRHPPSEDLSPEGWTLARAVAAELRPFDRTITSPARRAVQTATGLGHAPETIDPAWRELGDEASSELPWPTTFALARAAVARPGSAAGRKAVEVWRGATAALEGIPEDGALLVVGHGGFGELLVAGSGLPEIAAERTGPLRCLEGVRFRVDRGRALAFEIVRLPDGATRV